MHIFYCITDIDQTYQGINQIKVTLNTLSLKSEIFDKIFNFFRCLLQFKKGKIQ